MTVARSDSAADRDVARAGALLVCVFLACLGVYAVFVAPGAWFPRASEKTWNASQLGLVRGSAAGIVQGALVVTEPDASEITIVNAITDFPSGDYPVIAWQVTGLADTADVKLLWRTDVRPDELDSVPIRIENQRATPTLVARNPAWIGRITGLAIAIHGALPRPLVVEGVVAKPMGVPGILRDRLLEWFAFEPWNRGSIDAIAGGEEVQALPLPLLLAIAVGLAGLAVVGLARFRPTAWKAGVPVLLAALFVAAWALLDVRWTWNLARQARETAALYAGKDLRENHLANDDADLDAFAQRALAVLPMSRTRVFIASDLDYFRDRAAYHLYPHRVYFDPHGNRLPVARDVHAGDWFLVYRQRGIQFDRTHGKLRWDGGQIVDAELKLLERGAALFVIR